MALFVATRFNPPVASCVSSFDTAIFAPNAANGAAAVYDLTAGGSLDISRIFTGVKAVGDIKGSFSAANPPGLANIDQGTPTGGTAPPPATTPAATSGGPTPVSTSLVVPGSSVCR